MLKRLPSASFNENVPLGDRAFFFVDSNVEVRLGDVPLLGDLERVGDRLGEMLPNGERMGERTGDFDLDCLVGDLALAFLGEISAKGERTGDRTGDFDLAIELAAIFLGESLLGERLREVLFWMGDKLFMF